MGLLTLLVPFATLCLPLFFFNEAKVLKITASPTESHRHKIAWERYSLRA